MAFVKMISPLLLTQGNAYRMVKDTRTGPEAYPYAWLEFSPRNSNGTVDDESWAEVDFDSLEPADRNRVEHITNALLVLADRGIL